MSPLLFALVELGYWHKYVVARTFRGACFPGSVAFRQEHLEMARAKNTVGWWRSTWVRA